MKVDFRDRVKKNLSRLLRNEDKLRFNFEEPEIIPPKSITFGNRNKSTTVREPIPKSQEMVKKVLTQRLPTITIEETSPARKVSIRA